MARLTKAQRAQQRAIDDGIVSDLMLKVGDDVAAAMRRTLSISPEPRLPVAMAGVVAAIGTAAWVMMESAGATAAPETPPPETVLLCALLAFRTGTDHPDSIRAAYDDLRALQDAGRARVNRTEPADA